MAKLNNDIWLLVPKFLDAFDHHCFSLVSRAFRWTSGNQKLYDLWSSIFETKKWFDYVESQSTASTTPRLALMGKQIDLALHGPIEEQLYLVLLLGEHGEYYDDDRDNMLRALVNSLRLTPEDKIRYLGERYPAEIVLHLKEGKTLVLNVAQVLDIGGESNAVQTERIFKWSRRFMHPFHYKVYAPMVYLNSKGIEKVEVGCKPGGQELVFAINPTDTTFRGYLKLENYSPGFHKAVSKA